MTRPIEFLNNHRRAIKWLAAALSIYSLIGFLLVPWLIERQVGSLLEDRLQLRSEVESLYLNPFTFYTELVGLQVAEADGTSLLEIEQFNANLQFSRLLLLQVRLNSIAMSGMDLYLARESETSDTVTRLAQRWQETGVAEPAAQEEVSTEEAGLFPVTVDRIELDNLNVHITDSVPAPVFTSTISLDSASINNLSTLPDNSGTHSLQFTIDNDAEIRTAGNFSIDPLRFDGEFGLNGGFALAPLSGYASSIIPVSIDSGEFNATLDYQVDLSGESLALELVELNASVNSLNLASTETGAGFLDLGILDLSGGSIRIPENTATFAALNIGELDLAASRDSDGNIDLLELLNSTSSQPEQTESLQDSSTAETPWSVSLNEFRLTNNNLTFTDNALRTAYSRVISLDALVSNIKNQPDTQMPLEATIQLDSGGTLTGSGNLTVLPALSAEASLVLESLALNAIDPFLNEFTTLNLQNGQLDSSLTINIGSNEPFAVSGDLAITNIELIDTVLEAPLLTLPTLEVDNLSYSVAENQAEISELLIAGLSIRVIINEDGTTNIGESVRPANSPDDVETSETDSSPETQESTPTSITLGRIRLDNAAADFTDRDLPFEFNANVVELNANIDNISNTTSELTQVSLEGQVGEFGLMQLETQLDPFNFTDAANIDLRFSNIDLPEATPYVIKFAGREIDEGTIDLRLDYTLDNHALEANNQMTLDDLVLGERVEYPDAMDLPLDLALALLKDSNGVIEFEVPVSGELDNPEFNFGPAIRRAITNILTNIVAAPFRLLGNLIGAGEDAAIDQIRFLPGRADIAAPEQQVLLQLAEALAQRPELVLEIPLLEGGENDLLALKTAAVTATIEAQLASEAESDLSLVERQTAILEALYSATDSTMSLEEIRALHTALAVPEAESTDSTASATENDFDVIAYNNDLRGRLIEAEPIGANELNALAQQRLGSIEEFLSSTSLSISRLRQTDTVTVELDEEGWLVLEFGLSTE